jgi:hypothetical protein
VNTAKAVEPQWVPTGADCQQALIARFTEYVAARTGLQPSSYHELWQWSVRDIDEFWLSVWDYFAVPRRRRRWRWPLTPCPARGGFPAHNSTMPHV